MRSLKLAMVVAVILGAVCVPSALAQQPTGPATLENLLKPDEAPKPPAAPKANAADAGPARPAGTLVRPKDGVQHPDLDKAWAEYDAAVAKATEGIKAVIAQQFDAATSKGDLDAAEKWQAIGEQFEKKGELPGESATKVAVSAAVADYKRASAALAKAYESVVKSLTIEQKIDEAKAVRDEARTVAKAREALSVTAGKVVCSQPKSDDEWQKVGGKILTVDAKRNSVNPVATGIKLQTGQRCWVAAHPDDKWQGGGSKQGQFTNFRGYERGGWMALFAEVGGVVVPVSNGPIRAGKSCELRLFCEDGATPEASANNSGEVRVKVVVLED